MVYEEISSFTERNVRYSPVHFVASCSSSSLFRFVSSIHPHPLAEVPHLSTHAQHSQNSFIYTIQRVSQTKKKRVWGQHSELEISRIQNYIHRLFTKIIACKCHSVRNVIVRNECVRCLRTKLAYRWTYTNWYACSKQRKRPFACIRSWMVEIANVYLLSIAKITRSISTNKNDICLFSSSVFTYTFLGYNLRFMGRCLYK